MKFVINMWKFAEKVCKFLCNWNKSCVKNISSSVFRIGHELNHSLSLPPPPIFLCLSYTLFMCARVCVNVCVCISEENSLWFMLKKCTFLKKLSVMARVDKRKLNPFWKTNFITLPLNSLVSKTPFWTEPLTTEHLQCPFKS